MFYLPDRHMSSSNGTSEDELERIKIKQRKSFDQWEATLGPRWRTKINKMADTPVYVKNIRTVIDVCTEWLNAGHLGSRINIVVSDIGTFFFFLCNVNVERWYLNNILFKKDNRFFYFFWIHTFITVQLFSMGSGKWMLFLVALLIDS